MFYKQGTGDVLLNYENEVYFTNQHVRRKGQTALHRPRPQRQGEHPCPVPNLVGMDGLSEEDCEGLQDLLEGFALCHMNDKGLEALRV